MTVGQLSARVKPKAGQPNGQRDARSVRRRRLSEENFPKVVLQQERVCDAQALEEPEDVAVEKTGLAGPRSGIRAVFQVHFVDDDVLRVTGLARLGAREESEQRAVG